VIHCYVLCCTDRYCDTLLLAALYWYLLWYTVTCCVLLIVTEIHCYVLCFTDRYCDTLFRVVLYWPMQGITSICFVILIGTGIYKIIAMLYWKCCDIWTHAALYWYAIYFTGKYCDVRIHAVAPLTDSPILAVNRVVLPETALYRFILHFNVRYWVMKRDTEFCRSVFGLEFCPSLIYTRDFFCLWTAARFSDSPHPGADLVRWVTGGAVPSSTAKFTTSPVHLNVARARVIGT